MPYSIKSIESLHSVSAEEWNKLAGEQFPFARHEFLVALENNNAVGEEYGWLTHFILAYNEHNELVGALPLYIKYNSYGEFVFDWAWADAYHRYNVPYYPKLVVSIPYTPATGPRILVAEDADYSDVATKLVDAGLEFASTNNLSSFHCLFTNAKDTAYFRKDSRFMMRLGCQFHWTNHNYKDFDDYLEVFTSKKRKQVKRERRITREQDIEFEILDGHTASQQHWDIYHRFYENTFERKSGIPTLSKGFFTEIARSMPGNIVLVMAKYHGDYVASAFNLRGSDTLYGRHWGCSEYFDNLHFEACYYQGLDYCIEHGLKHFEPGAQGEHKIARGFMPTQTWSAHWIANPSFRESISQFLTHETKGMYHYIDELTEHSPFKKDQS